MKFYLSIRRNTIIRPAILQIQLRSHMDVDRTIVKQIVPYAKWIQRGLIKTIIKTAMNI
jgi:hypothetical protein